MRPILRTAIVGLVGLGVILPATAGPKEDEFLAWFSERTFDAVAISRIAARLCPNLTVDELLEKQNLHSIKVQSWADVPRDRIERAMAGFARDLSGACDYAWTMYGNGSGGSHNLGMRLLRRVVRNPF